MSIMPLDIDDDEYVANLLAQDAKKSTKTYDLVGLNAFNPRRSRAGAPKPNTNFLRHIIRQTDSHNAALLAKEAEESSSRLRQMNRERDKERTEAVDRAKRKIEGRLSPPPYDEQPRRPTRKDDDSRDKHSYKKDGRATHRGEPLTSRSEKRKDSSRDSRRQKRRHEDSDEDLATYKSKRSKAHREDARRSHYGSEGEYQRSRDRVRRRQHSTSRSPSRTRSRSPRRRTHRHRDRSRSPRHASKSPKASRNHRRRSRTPASDSDPLEAIVGPLPPPPEPTVRSRGRGALKANSKGIESHFSSMYDPSVDVRPGSDVEDDWGEALEVMRDRERWKQQGAERLRAAGFKDEQVKKWEKGGDPTEEDVVWSKSGQDREWDRGKVIDEDGDVKLRVEWGRLT